MLVKIETPAIMVAMLLEEFDRQLKNLLDFKRFEQADAASNGLQVGNDKLEIKKIALAVDASIESFTRAKAMNVDLLFVHHGLFWGRPIPLTGGHYKRVKFLLQNDLALYAVHLPLDAHPELGNNAGLAGHLGLQNAVPFGEYKGLKIGVRGRLPNPRTINALADRLCEGQAGCLAVLPFGPESNSEIGIVSGGAPETVHEAIEQKLDIFITGDASHVIYHECLEAGINIIFGGHYVTETFGIKGLAHYIGASFGIETVVLDIPTGL